METIVELPPKRLLGRYAYPTSHRVIEISAVVAFAGFVSVFGAKVAAASVDQLGPANLAAAALAILSAMVVADFLSGLVHALCDNLGSVDTPLVGQKFIRSFREHHTDPLDMTRGDFIRVNADNFLVCLPILVPAALVLDVSANLMVSTFLLALMGFVVVTNQIHKWAHTASVPASVRWLQARHLILSPEHHRIHHTPPYSSHYCITSGITNRFLTRVGFWPVLMAGCRSVGKLFAGSPATGSSRGPGA